MTLRIAVLVKQVAEPPGGSADTAQGMNTYDAYAVSEAISLKERSGADVTVISAGPASVKDVILRALATGADRGVHVVLDDPNGMDSLSMAAVLAGVLRDEVPDLILAGQTTDDYETGQVGLQVAELLGAAHVSQATHVESEGATMLVTRDAEGRRERVRVPAPCVVLVLSGRDSPQRYPSLRGMMAAKKKPVRVVTPGVVPVQRMKWSEPRAPEPSGAGIVVADVPPDEAAARLVEWLGERKLV